MGRRGPLPNRRVQALKGDLRAVADHPRPVVAEPPKPEGLGPVASEVWDQIVPELVRMRMVGRLDGSEVELFCTSFERWREHPGGPGYASLTSTVAHAARGLGLGRVPGCGRRHRRATGTSWSVRSSARTGDPRRCPVVRGAGARLGADMLDGDAFPRSDLLAARGLPTAPKPVTVTGFGLEEVQGVVMWRRKRWAEDQKTIEALSRANDRLTADLETMVSESERLKEEVRQRDEVIAGLRKELRSPRDED